MKNLRWILYGGVAIYFLYTLVLKPNNSNSYESTVEEAKATTGVITILQQQEDSTYLIEDEISIPNPEDSKVIVHNLDNSSDTLNLEELKAIASEEENSHSNRRVYRGVYYGFMGYMLGRSMGTPVRSSAYIDQNTYNKVNNGTGQRMRQTATRTTTSRPSGGKSGYGGSSSTRSYGG